MARTKTQLVLTDMSVDGLNLVLKQIEDAIDQLNGLHGVVNVYSDVLVHGNLTVTGTVTTANGTTAPDTAV